MKQKKVHLIGNAHIDPVWLWSWQEGFHEVKATFRSALDRMREYPGFIFTASSAVFYSWVEQSDPQMFAEIKQRVDEGRWQIVGGWWIEPDCNIPCGESFVRQGLHGQRYFMEKFGKKATIGYNVDSFGHSGMLPQILKKSGIIFYVFMRPMPHEMELPGRTFWWEADDGSRITAFQIPFSYATPGGDIKDHILRCLSDIAEPINETMCFYGVGNHGGGPTIQSLESILNLQTSLEPSNEVIFSSVENFYHNTKKENVLLPTVHSELQHHASGCYAAHSGVKRWNRLAENRLMAAEKWTSVAALTIGVPYPVDFDQAWKNVLFNQFHDILAGTSLERVYDDVRDTYGEAMAIADRALNAAFQSIIWKIKIDPEEGMRPILVFNPLTWEVRAPIEIDLERWEPGAQLVDDTGHLIHFQGVDSPTTPWRQKMCFIADLPALGYRTYRLMKSGGKDPYNYAKISDTIVENGRYRLEINPSSGCITSLFDLQNICQVFSGEAARAVIIDDPSDTWSHDILSFQNEIGSFKPTSVKLVENGPVKSVIRVCSEYGRSELIQDFTLYHDLDGIDVFVTVNWQEHSKMLKLRFPVRLAEGQVTCEIPYGTIERPSDGKEEPFQNWVDYSGILPENGKPYGLSIYTDGKYSLDVFKNVIGLTILRSPAYAHHYPAELKGGEIYSYMDQGIQRFCYTIHPHSGNWKKARIIQRASELNQRPFIMLGTFHPQGTLPQEKSFIKVQPDTVIVTVLKKAEDGDDLILRAYETQNEPVHAVISLPEWGHSIETDFSPSEIKTILILLGSCKEIIETSLLED